MGWLQASENGFSLFVPLPQQTRKLPEGKLLTWTKLLRLKYVFSLTSCFSNCIVKVEKSYFHYCYRSLFGCLAHHQHSASPLCGKFDVKLLLDVTVRSSLEKRGCKSVCQCWDCAVIQLILDMSVSSEQCSQQLNPCGRRAEYERAGDWFHGERRWWTVICQRI